MVRLRTETGLAAMREAGRVVAQMLNAVREAARTGVGPRGIDAGATLDGWAGDSLRSGMVPANGMVPAIEPVLIAGGGDRFRPGADG